jgi:hypothetical protein
MFTRSTRLAVVAAAVLTAATGCATTGGRVYVRTGPPPVIAERRVEPPGPGFLWQPGYYRWAGRDYVWVPGRYERGRLHAAWVSGRWLHNRHGWYFVEGHWR